ncbi:hypothetical protein EG327_006298 [Venturia inaequalis]|uniref:adenine phosphoribosyltransferase n=1 Tax=Venturia inaequalis TaxID=5025 RepID=A0A8H3V556_VENIN|nr:hypothetical protein EG327_006298 [Venturia inaequalis]
MAPKLIILATGDTGTGKDYCASTWATVFEQTHHKARVVSISDEIKREYALATGADLSKLLDDRSYKEQHRPALTSFWQKQIQTRPDLPAENFLRVVNDAVGFDVLIVTGMRDEAPVATFSCLVPESRILDVRIETSEETRRTRLGNARKEESRGSLVNDQPKLDYCPSLVFTNNTNGPESASQFAETHLLPYLHADFGKLSNMVPFIPNFPRPGVNFRHILSIAQKPGGLALCTSLLHARFFGDWKKIDALVAPEVGGIVFASALAERIGVPLWLIRKGGKLPPPVVSTGKPRSFVSNALTEGEVVEEREGAAKEGGVAREDRIEMEIGVTGISTRASVVVIDDVLSTGETLCAVLQLLKEAGVGPEDVSVLVVAEFPKHRGREVLRQRGFGRVQVQSLLVFGGE